MIVLDFRYLVKHTIDLFSLRFQLTNCINGKIVTRCYLEQKLVVVGNKGAFLYAAEIVAI
jgi:hypothetical protein